MNPQTAILVSQILDLLISGVVVSVRAMTAASSMVKDGRDPTPEEWAALDAELKAARASLHSDGPDTAPSGGIA